MKIVRPLVVLGLVVGISVPAAAQRRNVNPRVGNAERVLQMRERLELSDEQITRLNELRVADLERRKADTFAMMDVRSRLEAGEISREQARALMTERRARTPETATAPERLNRLLTENQQSRLRALNQRGANGRVPRAGRARGRGPAVGVRGGHRRGVAARGGRIGRSAARQRRGLRGRSSSIRSRRP